jgi:hypothetical protein
MSQVTLNVYALFWVEAGQPIVRMFDSDELNLCMQHTEILRTRKRAGEPLSHITFCSENPDRVGEDGTADPNPNYSKLHWKRRIDPNVTLGRDSRNSS